MKGLRMTNNMMGAGEVIDLIGCGRSTFYKWLKAEKFPKGTKINGLRKWWPSVVLDFINGGTSPAPIASKQELIIPVNSLSKQKTEQEPEPKRKLCRLPQHVKPKGGGKGKK